MGETTVSRKEMTESYAEVRDTVLGTARRFARSHGGDVGELCAEANLHFVRACRRYAPARGPFRNYVRFFVRVNLLETARNEARRRERLPRQPGADVEAAGDPDRFRLGRLLADLGPDAAAAVRFVVSDAAGLGAAARIGGDTPTNRRKELKKHLRTLGWGAERARRAMAEVKEAL